VHIKKEQQEYESGPRNRKIDPENEAPRQKLRGDTTENRANSSGNCGKFPKSAFDYLRKPQGVTARETIILEHGASKICTCLDDTI